MTVHPQDLDKSVAVRDDETRAERARAAGSEDTAGALAASGAATEDVQQAAVTAAAVVTAAAMVTAARSAAREVTAASYSTAETSPADVALDIVDRAAATAEAMVTAAEATASRAAERARHQAQIQGQADLLSAVLDGISDGVEVVDENGFLLMRNRAAAELGVQHGRTEVDGSGEDFGMFRPDGITPFPAQETPLMRALAGESSDGVVLRSRSAAHPYGVLLAVSGRPLRDAAGRPAAVAVYRDITTEHAQRTELETFAAVAAHDLSTPLAIIRGYLDVLADVVLPELTAETAETAADMLRRAQDGTVRMSRLIDDLLHYATGDAALVIEDIDLRAQVCEVIAQCTEHLAPGTPAPAVFVGALPSVRGDRSRITQLLHNVIGNALKYTPPGQPAHIDITARLIFPRSGADSYVHVQIADRGIGIPVGHHAAIFNSFHRAHATSAHAGTGLGLAICQRIVERHGGHIYATDNPGGGTRMHFTLPRATGRSA